MVTVTMTKSLSTNNGNVTLDIVIGNGQIGASTVALGAASIPSTNNHYQLGSNLTGKQVIIQTVVTDVNQNTDDTIVTYNFTEGGNRQSFSNQVKVDQSGGMALYHCIASF